MLSPEELRESPLFQSISYESYLAMYDCFRAVNRTFRPYEVMYDYSSGSVSADSDSVGIIERGTASLIRIDENGVATVLEELGPGGVFGKALAFAGSSQDVLEVVCRTSCEVVYIHYSQILKRCENACLHHSVLVQNMLRLISELLTDDGLIIFSNNYRGFTLDPEAVEGLGLSAEDVTARTIPEDYRRTPKIHCCYLVRKICR